MTHAEPSTPFAFDQVFQNLDGPPAENEAARLIPLVEEFIEFIKGGKHKNSPVVRGHAWLWVVAPRHYPGLDADEMARVAGCSSPTFREAATAAAKKFGLPDRIRHR
jgi:hypothetical protein